MEGWVWLPPEAAGNGRDERENKSGWIHGLLFSRSSLPLLRPA